MKAGVEISIGVVLSVFVAIMFYESFNPAYEGFGQPDFPPMRFPRWILLGIGGLTLLHFVRVGLGLVRTEELFTQTLWKPVALVCLAALVSAMLIKPIGFTFASVLGFWAIGALLGYRNYPRLFVFGIAFGVGTWAVFTFLINLGLPTSPLFFRI